MNDNYLATMLTELLSENGELSAEQLAKALSSDEYAGKEIPIGNVRIVLFCRKIFGQNPKSGRWGLRDRRELHG